MSPGINKTGAEQAKYSVSRSIALQALQISPVLRHHMLESKNGLPQKFNFRTPTHD